MAKIPVYPWLIVSGNYHRTVSTPQNLSTCIHAFNISEISPLFRDLGHELPVALKF